MGYIYCITNLINNKRYVSKTTSTIEDRWKIHCQDSRKDRCKKRPLYSAFNKYGLENFKIEELEYLEDDFFRILYHLKTNNNEKLFKVQCW